MLISPRHESLKPWALNIDTVASSSYEEDSRLRQLHCDQHDEKHVQHWIHTAAGCPRGDLGQSATRAYLAASPARDWSISSHRAPCVAAPSTPTRSFAPSSLSYAVLMGSHPSASAWAMICLRALRLRFHGLADQTSALRDANPSLHCQLRREKQAVTCCSCRLVAKAPGTRPSARRAEIVMVLNSLWPADWSSSPAETKPSSSASFVRPT